jgi:L-cysteine desulfidase
VGGDVQRVSVACDSNVFKNALAVGVPGTGGLCGIPIAAALGTLAGDPDLRLEVLAPIVADDVLRAQQLVTGGRIDCRVDRGYRGIHIEATVQTGSGTGRAVIEGTHTGVTEITANGDPVALPGWAARLADGATPPDSLVGRSLQDVLSLAKNLSSSEKEFLLRGVRMNQAAGRTGITECPGTGYGANMARLMGEGVVADDVAGRATALAAAAADARMSGLKVSIMASGNSGNQGIAATIPVAEVARELGADDDALAYALATSHLVVAYAKSYVGNLSALCGVYAAAAPGAAAGIIRLLGGDESSTARAIGLLVGNVSGVICDGAKAGCAVKVGTAAGLAVRTAYLAMRGVGVASTDGIVASTPEESLRNLGRLAQAMQRTNEVILEIMAGKQDLVTGTGQPGQLPMATSGQLSAVSH